MKYKVCEKCGMNLDLGEVCDCEKKADASANAPTSNGTSATQSISYPTEYVKAALTLSNTLRSTRAKYGDIAEVVKKTFPKFSRQLLTACVNWEDYGVLIHPDGLSAIVDAYHVPASRKPERRKLDRRITFRCTSANFARIERNMERAGMNTLQEYVAAAVALLNEEIEHA